MKSIINIIQNARQKGFFHLLTANVMMGVLGFGSQLIVAKFLTPTELGEIRTLQSFLILGSVVAAFGLNTAVLKLCAEPGTEAVRLSILRVSTVYTALPTAVVLLGFYGAAWAGLLSPDPQVNKWMLIFAWSLPFLVYANLFMAYLQAVKRIHYLAAVQSIVRLVGLGFVVLATMRWGMAGFVIVGVSNALMALLPFVNLFRQVTGALPAPPGTGERSIHLGGWSTASNFFNTAGMYLDIFVLNYFVEDREVLGHYGLATIFLGALMQVTMTIQTIATPYFSEKSFDRAEFMRVLKKYQRQTVVVAFCIALGAAAAVPVVVRLVYGPVYADSAVFFQILTARYVIWSGYAIVNVAVLGLGRMKDNFAITAVTVPLGLVVSIVFVVRFGAYGAAVAQVVSGALILVVVWVLSLRVIRDHFRVSNAS